MTKQKDEAPNETVNEQRNRSFKRSRKGHNLRIVKTELPDQQAIRRNEDAESRLHDHANDPRSGHNRQKANWALRP